MVPLRSIQTFPLKSQGVQYVTTALEMQTSAVALKEYWNSISGKDQSKLINIYENLAYVCLLRFGLLVGILMHIGKLKGFSRWVLKCALWVLCVYTVCSVLNQRILMGMLRKDGPLRLEWSLYKGVQKVESLAMSVLSGVVAIGYHGVFSTKRWPRDWKQVPRYIGSADRIPTSIYGMCMVIGVLEVVSSNMLFLKEAAENVMHIGFLVSTLYVVHCCTIENKNKIK